MASRYYVRRARGGKDDAAIETALEDKWDAIRRGDKVQIEPSSLRRSHRPGKDRVDIQPDHVDFLEKNDYTQSPVPIQAAVRVLHAQGLFARFHIAVSEDTLSIQAITTERAGIEVRSAEGVASQRELATMGSTGPVPAPEQPCEAIHEALETLPLLDSPVEVPFADGLYFFYEEGEFSDHAPNGRIVRVGNHPRRQGGLVSRLRMHYSGNKNSSVFRKFLGGALLRRANPADPCLSPAPGKGHWESGNAKACLRCRPTEARVSELLRQRLRFRCVRVPDMTERNRLEALLVATVAACDVCRPSPSWLGLQAYSEKVRASGLWNSQYVGGTTIDGSTLGRFQELVSASLEPFGRLKKNM